MSPSSTSSSEVTILQLYVSQAVILVDAFNSLNRQLAIHKQHLPYFKLGMVISILLAVLRNPLFVFEGRFISWICLLRRYVCTEGGVPLTLYHEGRPRAQPLFKGRPKALTSANTQHHRHMRLTEYHPLTVYKSMNVVKEYLRMQKEELSRTQKAMGDFRFHALI